MGMYVVTGSSTGIGAGIRAHLEQAGHSVIGVDIKASEIQADLSTADGRQTAIDAAIALTPDGLDGLVTCAGIGSHVPNPALIASVNFFGSVRLVEGLLEHVARRNGSIVMISSNSAPHPTDDSYVNALLDGDEDKARDIAAAMQGHPVYSGSKLAVARWMRRQAPAYARQGVRINAVAPGYIETPMTQAVMSDPNYAEGIKQFLASIPAGRGGNTGDIASAVTFLLGEQAAFIAGSVLFVDGGHDAMFRPDQF